ncbi:MAG: hypothetical protein EI684_11440 [Candidatus Viridilinea halotolerans]|uniref:Uncharacterized protein n=1 Tax=Candidatus Viridilinea halotolerans TaxID=2491704 RepID=A0A426TZ88_9CHLR|nr:MAG: hypothetical protein EI684_11440 [Candidatus Viridilinea halotolerans]
MAKKANKPTQPNPALRLSTLGPHVNQLATSDAADNERFAHELNRLTVGLKPVSFLPILVNTLAALPKAQQQPLTKPVVAWLAAQGLIQPLQELEAKQTFVGPSRTLARHWLAAGEVSLAPIEVVQPQDLFIRGYKFGSPSQASVALFWYKDERRRNVHLLNCLLDYEPPWEGSLKDISYHTFRDVEAATQRLVAAWGEFLAGGKELDLAHTMYHIWGALHQSRAQAIRLPADFIKVRAQLVPALCAFPPHPDMPALNADELETMAHQGRSPEQINAHEREYGYQTRLPDGSIVRIGSLDD